MRGVVPAFQIQEEDKLGGGLAGTNPFESKYAEWREKAPFEEKAQITKSLLRGLEEKGVANNSRRM
jgi:hypothetical protein